MSFEHILTRIEEKDESQYWPDNLTLGAAKWLVRVIRQYQKDNDEVVQEVGKTLLYPWYKNDQVNFPGSTIEDGVCTGEHVSVTIVKELIDAYQKVQVEASDLTMKLTSKTAAYDGLVIRQKLALEGYEGQRAAKEAALRRESELLSVCSRLANEVFELKQKLSRSGLDLAQ